jgi:hypothetical protein
MDFEALLAVTQRLLNAMLHCAPAGSRSALQRTIYYWVGSKAAADKASVACIKAVELKRAISGGKCATIRQDEGQVSCMC